MLKKSARVSAHVLRAAQWTGRARAPLAAARWRPNDQATNRYAVMVGIRIARRTTERNRLKRIVLRAVREYPMKGGFDVLIVLQREARNASPAALQQGIPLILPRAPK